MTRREILRSLGTLVVAAQFAPLMAWAANRAEIGFPDGLLLWILLVVAAGFVLWIGMRSLRLTTAGASVVGFWAVLGLSTLGLVEDTTPGGAGMLFVLLTAFCALAYRLHRLRPFQWFHSWVFLFIAFLPSTLALHFFFTGSAQASPNEIDRVEAQFVDHPDVVLAIFDAHASLEVLKEYYGIDFASQYAPWQPLGAEVAPNMRANYPLTHLSLASVLAMGYPYEDGARVREGDWDHLLGTISGDNALVEMFKDQGYRYTMVESGWPGIHCTAVVDSCIRGIWPDEATRLTIGRSLFGSTVERVMKDSESLGALHSIRWIKEELPTLLRNGDADLVLLHLMLPHPPLRLDGDCRYRMRPGLGGRTLASPWFTDQEVDNRVAGYLEATRCARDVITHLLKVTEKNGILVAFGDHGPDSRSQLFRSPKDWSPEDIEERFGALFVTNSGCSIDDFHSLVNLGRWLTACLAGEQPNLVDDRFFVGGRGQRNVGSNPEPLLEVTAVLGAQGP